MEGRRCVGWGEGEGLFGGGSDGAGLCGRDVAGEAGRREGGGGVRSLVSAEGGRGRLSFGLSNVELMRRVGLRGMGELLVERRWRWLGHDLRMGPEQLPRKCLVVGLFYSPSFY